MAIAHERFLFRRASRLQMLFQGRDHFIHGSASESLLLGSSPRVGLGGSAVFGRISQIFADVKEITQKGRLEPEDLPALEPDPIGPVPHRMNMTV